MCCTVSTAPATPTLKMLTNELKSVLRWHTLGVNLELKLQQLGIIERNHRGDDERCRTEMLGCWLDNTTTPTWDAVAEALYQMDEHRVADEIRRKHITVIEGTVLLKSCTCHAGKLTSINTHITCQLFPSRIKIM